MDITRLKNQVTYKIEPNPAGGFIARSTDPSIAPIEADSAEELQKKIQTELMGSIGALLPGSNLPVLLAKIAAAGTQATTRTVTLNTSNGNSVITKEASPEERREFAKRIAGIMQKDFPELAQELSAKAERLAPSSTMSPGGTKPRTSLEPSPNVNHDGLPQNADSSPILPEANSVWKLVGIFAFVMAFVLFLLYAHR